MKKRAREIWFHKRGHVTSQIERSAYAAFIEYARQSEDPALNAVVDGMVTDLAAYDDVESDERGKDAQRAAAEAIASATPITTVDIRITRKWESKRGVVFQRGTVMRGVERRVSADYDPRTDSWAAEVTYGYHPNGISEIGYAIGGEYAVEI